MEISSIFLAPLRASFLLMVIVCFYIGLYLLLLAMLPEEEPLLEQIFLLLLIITMAGQVLDAFVVMRELLVLFQQFFLLLMPILSMMLLSVQAVFTLIAWNPILLVFIQFLLFISHKVVLPALVCSIVLDCCTRLLPAMSFAKASDLIRQSVLSVMVASIFTLTAALSFTGAAFFQLNEAVKSPIKKLIEQNIPLIGSLVVEGFSLFQKSQSAVFSFAGFAFLVVVWSVAFYPAITLLLHALTFKLLGAITEPLTNGRISGLFDDIGKTLFVLCALAFLLGFVIIFIVILCVVILQFGAGKR